MGQNQSNNKGNDNMSMSMSQQSDIYSLDNIDPNSIQNKYESVKERKKKLQVFGHTAVIENYYNI